LLLHLSAADAFHSRKTLRRKNIADPRELKAFRDGWIYLIGLLISVALILAFFTLNSATESPPFP
jgi:hypothetical protein